MKTFFFRCYKARINPKSAHYTEAARIFFPFKCIHLAENKHLRSSNIFEFILDYTFILIYIYCFINGDVPYTLSRDQTRRSITRFFIFKNVSNLVKNTKWYEKCKICFLSTHSCMVLQYTLMPSERMTKAVDIKK